VLQVSYKDTDPKKAAAVVNTLMGVYLEQPPCRSKLQLPGSSLQTSCLRPKLLCVKQSWLWVQEENKVVALEEEAKSAVAIIGDLQRQLTSAQTGLADAKAQSAALKNQLEEIYSRQELLLPLASLLPWELRSPTGRISVSY